MLDVALAHICRERVLSHPKDRVLRFLVLLGAVQGVYNKQCRLAVVAIQQCQVTVWLYNTQSDGGHLKRSRKDGSSFQQIWTFRLWRESVGLSAALHRFACIEVCYPSSYEDSMMGRADPFLHERGQIQQ